MESTSHRNFHAGQGPPSYTSKASVFQNHCGFVWTACWKNFVLSPNGLSSPNKKSRMHFVKSLCPQPASFSQLIRASAQLSLLSSPPKSSTQSGSQIKPNWLSTLGLLLPSDNQARHCEMVLSSKPVVHNCAVFSSRVPGCGYEKTAMLTKPFANSFIIPATKTRPSPLWPENLPYIFG